MYTTPSESKKRHQKYSTSFLLSEKNATGKYTLYPITHFGAVVWMVELLVLFRSIRPSHPFFSDPRLIEREKKDQYFGQIERNRTVF